MLNGTNKKIKFFIFIFILAFSFGSMGLLIGFQDNGTLNHRELVIKINTCNPLEKGASMDHYLAIVPTTTICPAPTVSVQSHIFLRLIYFSPFLPPPSKPPRVLKSYNI